MTDDWLAADRPAAELVRIRTAEEWLLTHADAVVACSTELQRRKAAARRGTPIELIPNAVDVAAYRKPVPLPADLPPSSAVYVGTLHTDRLDVELCESTAQALHGRGTLVLVGPSALTPSDADRLRSAGVVILGARSHRSVVGYLQHADVLVVPHVVSAFTDSLDPIKMYEYAAVGRPVVATAVAGFRDAVDPRIRVVAASEFATAVAGAVPAVARFPDGADGPVATWDDRATAVAGVLSRMPRR
jgi:glycosyltransferase involved in cell wall biosynthesis